jgi:hypothetical protein
VRIVSLRVKNDKATYHEITGSDILKATLPVAVNISTMLTPTKAYAAEPLSGALKPIIDVLKDLAEPVSYAFMIQGFIQMMAGNSEKGKKTIKNAIIGFIGVQWIPWIFSIIRGIGAK